MVSENLEKVGHDGQHVVVEELRVGEKIEVDEVDKGVEYLLCKVGFSQSVVLIHLSGCRV